MIAFPAPDKHAILYAAPCPTCGAEARKSAVAVVVTPQVPPAVFLDAEQRQHIHDPNIILITYKCKEHSFEKRFGIPCKVCGWVAEPLET